MQEVVTMKLQNSLPNQAFLTPAYAIIVLHCQAESLRDILTALI